MLHFWIMILCVYLRMWRGSYHDYLACRFSYSRKSHCIKLRKCVWTFEFGADTTQENWIFSEIGTVRWTLPCLNAVEWPPTQAVNGSKWGTTKRWRSKKRWTGCISFPSEVAMPLIVSAFLTKYCSLCPFRDLLHRMKSWSCSLLACRSKQALQTCRTTDSGFRILPQSTVVPLRKCIGNSVAAWRVL